MGLNTTLITLDILANVLNPLNSLVFSSEDLELTQEITLQTEHKTYILETLDEQAAGEKLTMPNPTPTLKKENLKTATYTTPSEYDALFNTYGNMFGVNPDKLKVMAKCESHINPKAISKSGAYGGLYQFSESTWISTRKSMGADLNPELRFDAEQAIMTAAWKIGHGGIGAWPICGNR